MRTKGALSQLTAKLMVSKLVMAAAKTCRRLQGQNLLPKLIEGVTVCDGVEDTPTSGQSAAWSPRHADSRIAHRRQMRALTKPGSDSQQASEPRAAAALDGCEKNCRSRSGQRSDPVPLTRHFAETGVAARDASVLASPSGSAAVRMTPIGDGKLKNPCFEVIITDGISSTGKHIVGLNVF